MTPFGFLGHQDGREFNFQMNQEMFCYCTVGGGDAFVAFRSPSSIAANSNQERPRFTGLFDHAPAMNRGAFVLPAITDGCRPTRISPATPNNHRSSHAQQQEPRKARLCWSPDLHQRFLSALDQLGGARGWNHNPASSQILILKLIIKKEKEKLITISISLCCASGNS